MECVERTAWLTPQGREHRDPGKHSSVQRNRRPARFFFPFPSLLNCFIDNKLSVITVPDRHDFTCQNIMNWEDHCCGRIIKEVREVTEHAAHMRQESNPCVATCVSLYDELRFVRSSLMKSPSWQPSRRQGERTLAIVSCAAWCRRICPQSHQGDFISGVVYKSGGF